MRDGTNLLAAGGPSADNRLHGGSPDFISSELLQNDRAHFDVIPGAVAVVCRKAILANRTCQRPPPLPAME
jgi:hypothetical protein